MFLKEFDSCNEYHYHTFFVILSLIIYTNYMSIKKNVSIYVVLLACCLFAACTTSKSTVSQSVDLSKYKYASIINNDSYHIPAELMEYEIQLFDAVESSHLQMVNDRRLFELSPEQQQELLFG